MGNEARVGRHQLLSSFEFVFHFQQLGFRQVGMHLCFGNSCSRWRTLFPTPPKDCFQSSQRPPALTLLLLLCSLSHFLFKNAQTDSDDMKRWMESQVPSPPRHFCRKTVRASGDDTFSEGTSTQESCQKHIFSLPCGICPPLTPSYHDDSASIRSRRCTEGEGRTKS